METPNIPFERRELRRYFRKALREPHASIDLLYRSQRELAYWISEQIGKLSNLSCYSRKYNIFAIYYKNSWREKIGHATVLKMVTQALHAALQPEKIEDAIKLWRAERLWNEADERFEWVARLNLFDLRKIGEHPYIQSKLSEWLIYWLKTIWNPTLKIQDQDQELDEDDPEVP